MHTCLVVQSLHCVKGAADLMMAAIEKRRMERPAKNGVARFRLRKSQDVA